MNRLGKASHSNFGGTMKRMSPRSVILFLCFVALSSALTLVTSAQDEAGRQVFKKGDRVLASPSSLKDEKYWRPCTVTEVHNFVPKRAYSITCDPQSKGGSTASFLVNEDWVKPLKAQDGDVGNDAHTPADNQAQKQNGAPAQDNNGAVACPASDADSKGRNALENSFRAAIRKSFEREPEAGADGRVTVTIQSLSAGQSHAYRVYEDPNEARGKTIYPVRATFTTCTDYNRRIVLVKRERAFSCYKNTAGEWVCDIHAAANTNVKDETKSIDKPRP
jgi:hypothetical protein